MAIKQLTVTVTLRWWVKGYLQSCVLFAMLFGMSPDAPKIVNFVMRHGVKVRIH